MYILVALFSCTSKKETLLVKPTKTTSTHPKLGSSFPGDSVIIKDSFQELLPTLGRYLSHQIDVVLFWGGEWRRSAWCSSNRTSKPVCRRPGIYLIYLYYLYTYRNIYHIIIPTIIVVFCWSIRATFRTRKIGLMKSDWLVKAFPMHH